MCCWAEGVWILDAWVVQPRIHVYQISWEDWKLHCNWQYDVSYNFNFFDAICNVAINGQDLNKTVVCQALNIGQKMGALSFLYHISCPKPCFGHFSPYLVKHMKKAIDSQNAPEAVIDSEFVGSEGAGGDVMGLSGLVWACLGLPGLAWDCLGLSWLVWRIFWSCLVLSGLVWACLG